MKIFCPCPLCSPDGNFNLTGQKYAIEISDSGIYEKECDEGHFFYCIPMNEVYEILYEAGAYALASGNYIEAVAYFANSLEKFRSFIIRFSDNIIGLPIKEIEKKLREVKLSERKIGAFNQAYAFLLKKTVKSFNSKSIKFRNEVIHEGKIPTYQETKDYGIEVMDYIKEIQKSLYEKQINYVDYMPTYEDNIKVFSAKNNGLEKHNDLATPHSYYFMIDFLNSNIRYKDNFDERFGRSMKNNSIMGQNNLNIY